MNYYLDILLKPDAEMRENVLMNKVYTKLHKALCDLQANDVGVSFPRYKIMLGAQLRLHANRERLDQIASLNWLGGLAGYCDVSGVNAVPENVQHRVISRIQTTMSNAKLQRLIKRAGLTEPDIKAYKAKMFSRGLDNPYVELDSGSNGHKHRRYLKFGDLQLDAQAGDFDQFGLSKSATVPWF
ncbi:MAG: type I-F CRISPR-associated endoribonuclease Cas6/Csy4 [Cypionkella sp.]|nr:type I-F CRISPR-associated endoribonuclease Cas6/Csy4 [Cypionkella sp.]